MSPQLQELLEDINAGAYAPRLGANHVYTLILSNMGLVDADLQLIVAALRNTTHTIIQIDASNITDLDNHNKFSHVKISGLTQLQILHLAHTGVTSIEIEDAPQLAMIDANHCDVTSIKTLRTATPRHCYLKNNGLGMLSAAITANTINTATLQQYLHYALLAYKTQIWPSVVTHSCKIYLGLLHTKYKGNTELIKEMPQIQLLPDELLAIIAVTKSGLKVSLRQHLQAIIAALPDTLQEHTAAISQAAMAITHALLKKATQTVITNPTVNRKKSMFFRSHVTTACYTQPPEAGFEWPSLTSRLRNSPNLV